MKKLIMFTTLVIFTITMLSITVEAGISDYIDIDFDSLTPATFYDISDGDWYGGATIPVLSGNLPWAPIDKIRLSLDIGLIGDELELDECMPVIAIGADLTDVVENVINIIPKVEVELPEIVKVGYSLAWDFEEDRCLDLVYFGFKIPL